MSDNGYLEIDLGDLRIREIEDLEDKTGRPFDALFEDGKPRGTVLRALGWVIKRRDDPDFTWEEAGELKIKVQGEVASPDPTGAGVSDS